MHITIWLRAILLSAVLLLTAPASAQTSTCKDSVVHRQLLFEMWNAAGQEEPKKVYDACKAMQAHARAEDDRFAVYTAWVCAVLYNLGKMNVHDAYHITQLMRAEMEEDKDAKDERYFVPNMMGHVYNTCGNIPGAMEEFKKSIELIKGSVYEDEGLGFVYLALAHTQLNNNLKESLRWIDEDLKYLQQHKDSWNYYRGMADAYAMKAIVMFKQRNYDAFRSYIRQMEAMEARNPMPSGDLFVPYARVYNTLLSGDTERALAQCDSLGDKKEQYLLKCDIYYYKGDYDKAFLTQRELMHKRDSITGVMIAENIQQQQDEIGLMKDSQKMGRTMNYVMAGAMVLLILAIVLLHRNLLIRRKFSKRLMAKNEELRAANQRVSAADQMKTDFIRTVSHEIRTPLNIINGFSQVLTDENNTFEPAERHEIAETIARGTRQITSLVNKMLALANMNTKDLLKEVEETDAVDICRRAIATMPPLDPEKIKMIFEDRTNGSAKLTTNSDCLLQILGNILENAAKFTEQGHIRLTVENTGMDMRFAVEDTGCGIPTDKIDTIFDRFMKVDEFTEGLGLGLAYCYETTERLGGSLKLESTSSMGTTFVLTLPIKLKTN